jgi:propionyl-CoA carboxylase alpha chain/3-methylcrotonyl-CoA carboxylase alpha subunit
VTAFYDPLIAKLIAHAPSRTAAAACLADACRAVEVWPVKTNAAFLARCLDQDDFIAGAIDTGFIEARAEVLLPGRETPPHVVAAAALTDAARIKPEPSPWGGAPGGLFGFRMNAPPTSAHRLERDGEVFTTLLTAPAADSWTADTDAWSFPALRTPRGWIVGGAAMVTAIAADRILVFADGATYEFGQAAAALGAEAVSDGAVLSPMPGKIILVSVAPGDAVKKGQALLTLEAMKMEHVLAAPFDGVVAALSAREGDQVAEGFALARLEQQD